MQEKLSIVPSPTPGFYQIKVKIEHADKCRIALLPVWKQDGLRFSDENIKKSISEEIEILKLSIECGVLYAGVAGLRVKENCPDYKSIIRRKCKVVGEPIHL